MFKMFKKSEEKQELQKKETSYDEFVEKERQEGRVYRDLRKEGKQYCICLATERADKNPVIATFSEEEKQEFIQMFAKRLYDEFFQAYMELRKANKKNKQINTEIKPT